MSACSREKGRLISGSVSKRRPSLDCQAAVERDVLAAAWSEWKRSSGTVGGSARASSTKQNGDMPRMRHSSVPRIAPTARPGLSCSPRKLLSRGGREQTRRERIKSKAPDNFRHWRLSSRLRSSAVCEPGAGRRAGRAGAATSRARCEALRGAPSARAGARGEGGETCLSGERARRIDRRDVHRRPLARRERSEAADIAPASGQGARPRARGRTLGVLASGAAAHALSALPLRLGLSVAAG